MIVVISLARHCAKCKKWAIIEQERYDIPSLEELDDMPISNLIISDIICCGLSEPPTHVVYSGLNGEYSSFVRLGGPGCNR